MRLYTAGDEVLAPWQDDGFLYPAVLVHLDGNRGHVAYFDGDEADVDLLALRLGVFGPGLAVQVNWKGQRRYYAGTIVGRVGPALRVVYETGETEWTTLAQCRIRREVAAALPLAQSACGFCGASSAVADGRCAQCGAPLRPPGPRA